MALLLLIINFVGELKTANIPLLPPFEEINKDIIIIIMTTLIKGDSPQGTQVSHPPLASPLLNPPIITVHKKFNLF